MQRSKTWMIFILAAYMAAGSSGCATRENQIERANGDTPRYRAACAPNCDSTPTLSSSALEALAKFNQAPDSMYLLGPGDSINVTVWGHPEISGTRVVGPDGSIQVALLGSVVVAGLTADQAGKMLTRQLSDDYIAPVTSIQINTYTNNKVTVLGDVGNPGVIHFDGQPTLLEALAKAGTLKGEAGQVPATRCAIFRGSDRVVWLNLRPLYRGSDLAMNLALRANDVIYVPYAVDNVVYVMGQVSKPGAYPVTPNMSLIQALAQAGGPTDNATPGQVALARPSEGMQKVIDLNGIVNGDGESNYSLEAGDIVFVPKRGLAKVGYVLQQLNPLTQTLFFGAAIF
jgi:polysaccharide biosynthesis/export protein